MSSPRGAAAQQQAAAKQQREAANRDFLSTRRADRTLVQPHRFAVLRRQLHRPAPSTVGARSAALASLSLTSMSQSASVSSPKQRYQHGKSPGSAAKKPLKTVHSDDYDDDDGGAGYSSDELDARSDINESSSTALVRAADDGADGGEQMSLWLQCAGTRPKVMLDENEAKKDQGEW